ncbi:group III truncated hemoglobin [Rhodohalobacter barkolensis]|uniref:Sec-independent protein translocase TatC n=1 Tax=Rhodohalobacter barkolensis TaxID=2053187 RepID=A0A2N0VJU6_9BACT|nr:group III truncated hemoglobin [Rhodohalobacter barkolensis]PKD44461.1 sec-independent protein translocase TatC [Rhodohalobacter barkolensis]
MNKPDIRNKEDIRTMVYAFYGKVREDERLGYIFNDVAKVDWDSHLPKMVEFWSKMLFQTQDYHGKPFRKHMPLPIKREDFSIWYGLFKETVDEHFEGDKAEFAKDLAGRVAASFTIRMDMAGKFNQDE